MPCVRRDLRQSAATFEALLPLANLSVQLSRLENSQPLSISKVNARRPIRYALLDFTISV